MALLKKSLNSKVKCAVEDEHKNSFIFSPGRIPIKLFLLGSKGLLNQILIDGFLNISFSVRV